MTDAVCNPHFFEAIHAAELFVVSNERDLSLCNGKSGKSTEYREVRRQTAKILDHSLFLNVIREGAVSRRAGKSRTNAAMEGCHVPLNPK
jgi:hypothetical protein